jgi:hypothetical protein
MSIKRYLAASGTAGLERMAVSGKSRVPRPPPSTSATTFFTIAAPDIVEMVTNCKMQIAKCKLQIEEWQT